MATSAINRRDFLRFKKQESRRVAEINCQRLHMNYVSLQATAVTVPAEHDDFADGEPRPVFAARTVKQLFADLARDVQSADAIAVVGREWLVPDELRVAFDRFIQAFAQRGGAIEYTT
jgi:hypothetical protein